MNDTIVALQAVALFVNTVTLLLLALSIKKHTDIIQELKQAKNVVNNVDLKPLDNEALIAAVKKYFYVAPQRYILNANPEDFKDKEGNPVPWEVTLKGEEIPLAEAEDVYKTTAQTKSEQEIIELNKETVAKKKQNKLVNGDGFRKG